jgi:hypothetical protein
MTVVQDHPDIEKIAAATNGIVDGIPVRETIREIFRNPENGTPDNISKAGCLALATKGAAVWNAWRAEFPIFQIPNEYPPLYLNNANFSQQNFKGILRDLRGFNFGVGAVFDQSEWGGVTKFEGARGGDFSRFFGAVWGDHCSFDGAQWGESCRFDGASWGQLARFTSARWGRHCMFNGARWGSFTSFANAELGGYLDFKNCFFEHGAVFDFSRFGADIRFAGSIFGGDSRFTSSDDADTFYSIDFGGCEFKGEVDFGGRRFLGSTNFGTTERSGGKTSVLRDKNGLIIYQEGKNIPCFVQSNFDDRSAIFCKTPNFHGCELHQDTSFEGAQFPPATGSEEAARAYRTLKLAFSKQQAVREEQHFFRLEMDEERVGHRIKGRDAVNKSQPFMALREHGAWLLYWLYKQTSDYGFSIARPLLLLAILWLIFAQIYGSYTGVERCFNWTVDCKIQSDWLNYSLQQALPLPGFDKLKPVIEGISVAWLSIHKTLSLAALFLIGLALRNLFKLK